MSGFPQDLTVVDLRKQERRVIKTGYTSYSLGVTYSKAGDKVSNAPTHNREDEVIAY